jgi:uncharacterized protein with NRDE domain
VGGKDLWANGTWLGLNEHGLMAGLLNRRTADYGPANPNLRSRGLLCLDVLGHADAESAARFVATQQGTAYNAFNLLFATRKAAYVAYNRGGDIEVVSLTPGLHLLTNADVDDFECPRISRAYGRFAELGQREDFACDPVGMREELRSLLADHSTQLDPRSGRPNALCMHLGGYGTRSSSLIFMGEADQTVEHVFAAGPPCTTPFTRAPVPDHASQK